MNPLCHLSSPASPFSQSQIFLPPPLPSSAVFLLCVTHSSSTKVPQHSVPLLPSALIPVSFSYPQSVPVPETNDAQRWSCWCLVVVGTGPGWLADLQQAQMTQAGVQRWGRQQGWDCGNYWGSGGVLISATALREHAGINWNYISISKELSSVQNMSILNMLNIGWRLFCETDNRKLQDTSTQCLSEVWCFPRAGN